MEVSVLHVFGITVLYSTHPNKLYTGRFPISGKVVSVEYKTKFSGLKKIIKICGLLQSSVNILTDVSDFFFRVYRPLARQLFKSANKLYSGGGGVISI